MPRNQFLIVWRFMVGILSSVYHTSSSIWLIFNWHMCNTIWDLLIFSSSFLSTSITFMRSLLMQQIV